MKAKVVQSATAKGQADVTDESEDTGKQRSTFLAFESSSSDTTVAANDMRKDGHGLQEYTVLLLEEPAACVMKAANRGEAHDITLFVNESVAGFCRDINAPPVKLMSDPVFEGT